MPLVVRGTPYSCWRCGQDDVAVAVIHLDGFARAHEVITTEAGLSLAYAAELLAAAGHAQAVTIKVRRSRAARRAYLSNGCIRCDSLFGQFPVSEDVTSMLAYAVSDMMRSTRRPTPRNSPRTTYVRTFPRLPLSSTSANACSTRCRHSESLHSHNAMPVAHQPVTERDRAQLVQARSPADLHGFVNCCSVARTFQIDRYGRRSALAQLCGQHF